MKETKSNKNTDKFSFKELVGLLIVVAVVSLVTGFAFANRILKDKNHNLNTDKNDSIQNFIDNYNYIVDNYYGEIDENKLLNAALEGVLESLGDPYTVYIDENEVDNFNIQLEGSYEGLGVEVFVNDSNQIEVLTVFDNSPASKSGLIPGDVIVKIDGNEISDSKVFVEKVKEMGTKSFKLTIYRNNKELELNVKKEIVNLESVVSKVLDNNIGYLGISIFANNTYEQVKSHLQLLETKKIESLIIDVRGNTGGHLTAVENILNLFLDNSHIIYKIEDESGIESVYSKGKVTKTYPIIVLTNEISASASEILTAALKEECGAKSVGKKTYGKGSAQELRTLPDGTKYKITTKKWLTPRGNSIDGAGIEADLVVEFDKKYYENPVEENDTQLQAAINLLLGL